MSHSGPLIEAHQRSCAGADWRRQLAPRKTSRRSNVVAVSQHESWLIKQRSRFALLAMTPYELTMDLTPEVRENFENSKNVNG